MLFDLNQTMQYSTPESWIPCDTEVQLLCPSKPSPWSKVRRACTQWLPKNLVSRSTLVHCFSFCPLRWPSSLSGSGCGVFWLGVMWSPSVSLLLSHGVVNWSLSCNPTSVALPAGATSPRLHLPALEPVRCLGFAVPPGLVLSCFPPVCQLWIWCLQYRTPVMSQIQSKYVFISAASVWVWFFCFCGNSGINAHVVRTAGKGSLFSHCFIFPVKFVPCVPFLPPVKKQVLFFLVLPPGRSSPLPGDHEFFIYSPWTSYSSCLLPPFTILSLFHSDWPRFLSLIPKRDFGA